MNKKIIERILKNLLENETYTIEKEETEILLNYIADLQRKEYNNSKAIEYIKEHFQDDEGVVCKIIGEYEAERNERFLDDLLNILEKGE